MKKINSLFLDNRLFFYCGSILIPPGYGAQPQKIMPSELAAGFTLAAVLPRAAVEDVLITKKNPDWNGSGTLATGSVRRRLMARTYWGPACGLKNLRGMCLRVWESWWNIPAGMP